MPSSASVKGATDELFDMMGYALPPGTIVGTQAWSMHRDASVFPSPDAFLPERWLSTNPEQLARMTAHMMPFGTGTRICGGQNLALMMLRLGIASFVRNFEIRTPAETTDTSMEVMDSFVLFLFTLVYYRSLTECGQVIFPASMECKLTFVPRHH